MEDSGTGMIKARKRRHRQDEKRANAESHMANTWRKPKPSLHRKIRSEWKDAIGITRLQQAKALAQTAVKFRPSDGPASEAIAMLNVVAVSTASA